MYPMMGEPPSDLGLVHCKVIESELEDISLGVPGAPGGSNGNLALMGSVLNAGSESPY